MAANQMLTVRITAEDLEKLDRLAAIQGRPRSQLVSLFVGSPVEPV